MSTPPDKPDQTRLTSCVTQDVYDAFKGKKLTPSAKLALIYFAGRQGKNDDTWVGNSAGAQDLDMPVSTFKHACTVLRKAGLLNSDDGGKHRYITLGVQPAAPPVQPAAPPPVQPAAPIIDMDLLNVQLNEQQSTNPTPQQAARVPVVEDAIASEESTETAGSDPKIGPFTNYDYLEAFRTAHDAEFDTPYREHRRDREQIKKLLVWDCSLTPKDVVDLAEYFWDNSDPEYYPRAVLTMQGLCENFCELCDKREGAGGGTIEDYRQAELDMTAAELRDAEKEAARIKRDEFVGRACGTIHQRLADHGSSACPTLFDGLGLTDDEIEMLKARFRGDLNTGYIERFWTPYYKQEVEKSRAILADAAKRLADMM